MRRTAIPISLAALCSQGNHIMQPAALRGLKESGYWETLGRFIEAYAELEQAVSGALWSFAKVSPQVARAIFSGTRADAASKNINRILDGSRGRQKTKRDFNYVFAQLGHVTEARNLIIHHETIFSRKGWIATNRRFAIDKKRLKERPVSVEILNQMIHDLEKMSAHLLLLVFQNEKAGRKNIKMVEQAYATELAAPWRYKPPQPQPHRRRKRRKHPKRLSQPAPLPG
jgi:hypothetical protein